MVSACVKDQRHTLLDLRHIFTFYFLWSYFQFMTIVHDMLLIFFVEIFLKIQFRPMVKIFIGEPSKGKFNDVVR